MRSRYLELAPSDDTSRQVLCTWAYQIGDEPGGHSQRVLPDCCADILWIGDSPALVVGPATRWEVTPLRANTLIVGVRFKPGWVSRALGVPANELLDRDVPLADLWGRSADLVSERISGERTVAGKVAAAERALAARWADQPAADPLVIAAVEWLVRRPAEPVHVLARTLGVSARHLQRRFVAAVGYGPKTFQRIARFQRLLGLGAERARRGDTLGLTDAAYASGYADQAHMTREVHALGGRTPREMVGPVDTTLGMSELFKTSAAQRA